MESEEKESRVKIENMYIYSSVTRSEIENENKTQESIKCAE